MHHERALSAANAFMLSFAHHCVPCPTQAAAMTLQRAIIFNVAITLLMHSRVPRMTYVVWYE